MKGINIPGLLIEYIISGAIAFIWVLLFISRTSSFDRLSDITGAMALIAIPCAYVLGMLVDNIAFLIVYKIKPKIRQREVRRGDAKQIYLGVGKDELEKLLVKNFTDKLIIDLHLQDKENLVEEIKWRSSRDRIARGFIVNSFLIGIGATMAICNYCSEPNGPDIHWSCFLGGILLSVAIAVGVLRQWMRYEMLSFRFQVLTHLKTTQQA